jgi:NAD(P)-dependent dehydrogenase (short-subunit alcohol dehydrogenase family)
MDVLSRFSLAGKVAVITGSSAGIGRAIAGAMAEAGADVVLSARGAPRLRQACSELEAGGHTVLGVAGDASVEADARHLVAEARKRFGRIDVLVNNAGASFGPSFKRGRLLELSEQDLQGCMTANVGSMFLCSTAAAPLMLEQGRGAIINMSSIAGRDIQAPAAPMALYSAAKAAIISLTMSMAAEWGPAIRVNVLTPGLIDTPRTAGDRPSEARPLLEAAIGLRRIGLPEDVAGAAVFLASDAASWISGASFDIHGGRRAPSPTP